jgi:prepilin-type N-terminal cleavage/methylation domain-containing protein
MKGCVGFVRLGLRDRRGFTLLELLVAVGVLAIAMGVSTPMLSRVRSHYVLDGVSRQIALEISKARMQAISQNRTVRLQLGSNSYVIECSADGAAFEPIADPVVLPAGVEFAVGDGGLPRFNRQGMAPNSTTISLSSPAGVKTIRTSALGRVTRS